MKESRNVPLTKAQRQALLKAAAYYLVYSDDGSDGRMAPALRNAIERLNKIDREIPVNANIDVE